MNGFLVPAQTFNKLINQLPKGAVTIEVSDQGPTVTIRAGAGMWTLPQLKVQDYPDINMKDGEDLGRIEATDIKHIVDVTRFSSTNEFRLAMCGVLVDGVRQVVVATDGFRLASRKVAFSSERSFIIPRDSIGALTHFTDGAEVSISPTKIKLSNLDTQVTVRTVNETFPNWETIVPAGENGNGKVNAEDLNAAVSRAAVMSQSETKRVGLKFSEESCRIAAQCIEIGGEGTEPFDCEYTGEEVEIFFNHVFLAELLNSCEGADVTVSLQSPTRPCVIRRVDTPNDINLIMPIRPNDK